MIRLKKVFFSKFFFISFLIWSVFPANRLSAFLNSPLQNNNFSQSKLKSQHKIFNGKYKDSLHLGVKYAEEALVLSRKINNQFYETEALIYIGRERNVTGKLGEAKQLLKKALTLAKQQKNLYQQARANFSLGFSYNSNGIPDSALYYSKHGYDIASAMNYFDLLKRGCVILATSYNIKGDRVRALKYCEEAIKFSTADKRNLADIYRMMGVIYVDIGDTRKGLDYNLRALKLFEELKDWESVGFSYTNIAPIYAGMGESFKSTNYTLKALEIFQRAKSYRGLGYVYNNLGMDAAQNKDYNNALSYYKESLASKVRVNDKQGIVFSLNNTAGVYFSLNKLDSVLFYAKQAQKYAEEINDNLSLALTYQMLGIYYYQVKNLPASLAMANKSLNYAKEINYQSLIEDLYENLSNIYDDMGDKPNAFYYLKLRNEIHDSINTANAQKYAADMIVKYELGKKENQLKQINEKNIGLQSEITQHWWLNWLILGISTLIIVTLLFYYRRKVLALFKLLKIVPKRSFEDKRRLKSVIKAIEQQPEANQPKQIDIKVTGNLIEKLNQLMTDKKIYLDSKITQAEVAKKLNTNTTYLSRIINENLCSNFSNYINQFRIEEAKKLIQENQQNNLTFEGIAQNVGFNSKSAFNHAFKKFTGKTPSEFVAESNPGTATTI